MILTARDVAVALMWAAVAAVVAWLASWPVRRLSVRWLVLSVAVTGTAASIGALFGAIHTMLVPMDLTVPLVWVTVISGALGLGVAAAVAGRINREHRAVTSGLAQLATGQSENVAEIDHRRRGLGDLRDQLRNTAAALARSREREQTLEASRRELIAWISHDLRTPLTGLRAMTEALEDDLTDEPHLLYREMGAAVDRLTGMVNDLFELSRVQAGSLGQSRDPIDLVDLVSDCIAALRPLASAQQVRLVGHVEAPVSTTGGVAELDRALTNVVANAIRHTPPDGVVEVRVGRAAIGWAEVSVTDGCGGIPADIMARIFDVGYRGSSARHPQDGGAGLGLPIARGILQAHHGRIEVENVQRGCRFRLQLPSSTYS